MGSYLALPVLPQLASSLAFALVQTSPEFVSVLTAVFPAALIRSHGSVEELRASERVAGKLTIAVVRTQQEAESIDTMDTRSEFGAPSWAILAWDSRAGVPDPANMHSLVEMAVRRFHAETEVARLRGDLRTFSRRITHDLRSPLNAISTSAEVIREVLAERLPEEVELTDPILDSTREILPVLDQLTVITRATAIPAERKDFSMEDAVHNTLDRFISRSMARGATVRASETWPKVHGVAGWAESIWAQLLANSLTHAGPSPTVTLGWEPRDHVVRFWIQDSGTVPEEKRTRLFHPFHLRHQSDAPHGMGLSIVQRLVEMQDGKVGFEPLDAGSRFFFELPRAQAS